MTTKIGTQKKPRLRRKSANIWHLVTNHQNMLYMLAAGMVMGPAGESAARQHPIPEEAST